MKKCCLNCAFCARCVNDTLNTLTNDEREQAFASNFEFVGWEQRAQRAWQILYKQIYEDVSQGKYHELLGGGRNVLELLAASDKPDDFTIINMNNPLVRVFNLPAYPTAPYNDYLSCWHEQWNNFKTEEDFNTLKDRKCPFFYEYEKKGKKSFECCEKERIAELEYTRYKTTNWLVIIGIFVSIIAIVVSILLDVLQNNDGSKVLPNSDETAKMQINKPENQKKK